MNSNEVVEFVTDHLLSKWGFDDGDLLEPFLQENGFATLSQNDDFWMVFNALVLCEVVECFVCPQIQNKIKPYRCFTSHNLIRVYEVDGQQVSDQSLDSFQLKPFEVSVSKQKILDLAQNLYGQREYFKDDQGEWSYLITSEFALDIRKQQGWDS